MATTTIIMTCKVNGCNEHVLVEFDPGEPMTRDFPGYPDRWIAWLHGGDDDHHHLELFDYDADADRISCMNYDNQGEWERF